MNGEFRVYENVAAGQLTTFAIGGKVQSVYEPASIRTLARLIQNFLQQELSWRVLGFGSNVVIPDGGVDTPVIRLGQEFNSFAVNGDRVVVGGAVSLMALSRKISEAGYSGLEFAAGIPASVGGAVRMNAGAHGKEIGAIVSRVTAVSASGEVCRLSANELAFQYRTVNIPHGCIVVEAELLLVKADREQILEERTRCLEYRKRTQPLHLPSAGSVFRNPGTGPNESAGYLLERVGLKGHRLGGVCYSELHANWLVKCDESARADDVRRLIDIGREKVLAEFGTELIPELVLW